MNVKSIKQQLYKCDDMLKLYQYFLKFYKMRTMERKRSLFVLISFLILFISLKSYQIVPQGAFLGIDLQSNYAFHHCKKVLEDNISIYAATGLECNDYNGRRYGHPPAMYKLFVWMRIFDEFKTTYYVWIIIYIFSFIYVFWIIFRKISSKNYFVLFSIFLFFQFPSIFAMERGNNDILIVLLWTLGLKTYYEKHYFAFGGVASAACFLKLYPIFSIMTIIVGEILYISRYSWVKFTSIIKGFIITSILLFSFQIKLWISYITETLPYFITTTRPLNLFSHSLKSLPLPGFLILIMYIVILLLFSLVYIKHSKNNISLALSGCLAISTLYGGVSYDYNLITIYPFIITLFMYVQNKLNFINCLIFYLLLLSFIGDPDFFNWGYKGILFRAYLQPLSLIFCSIMLLKD